MHQTLRVLFFVGTSQPSDTMKSHRPQCPKRRVPDWGNGPGIAVRQSHGKMSSATYSVRIAVWRLRISADRL